MANTNCCGGTTTTTTCDSTIAELPRYYPRQLITPDDLTLEQNYFRDRMRRHNRLLHGWGVVCGGLVCPATTTNSDGTISLTPWQVKVQKGYILGPYGDEIIIDCCRTVDLRTSGVSGVTGQPCIDTPDPWCSQVFIPPTTNTILYIAVQYKQCMMRPVRVQTVGCGCNGNTCEYSRWHDGYQIGVLTSPPACQCGSTGAVPNLQELLVAAIPTCPDCSCGPWVCLAAVTVSGDGSGTIQEIDNQSCRRMALSFSGFCWIPQSATLGSSVSVTGAPVAVTQGTPASITVTDSNDHLEVGPDVTYSFGPGVTVTVTSPTPTAQLQDDQPSVTLSVTASNSVTGPRPLTIINADCSTYVVSPAIQVSTATTPSAPSNLAASQGASSASPAKASPASKASGKTASQASSGADKTASKGAKS